MRPIYILAALIVIVAMLLIAEMARAHAWYTRTNCCNGNDCAPVPLDAGWVVMEEHGYQITLSLEQAKLVNPDATIPIDVFIPWRDYRIKSPPVLKAGETYGAAIYHLCIPAYSNGVYCLFVVPGT